METALSAAYAELHRRHWWWRAREQFLLGVLRQRGLCDGRRILDVGCAAGAFFDALSRCGEVFGVEPDSALRDQAGKWRSRIHLGHFDRSYRPPHRYGLVLMLDVLEHMPEPAAGLSHALDLLEPGGEVVITVPAFQWLWTHHDEINEHFCRYDMTSFHKLAAAAGLEIRNMQYFFHWLVGPKLAVRMLEALTARPPRPPRMPPSWLNHVFYRLSCAEQALTRALPIPFGTSLLVVGGRPNPNP